MGYHQSNRETPSTGRRFQIGAQVTHRNLLMPEKAGHRWKVHSLTCWEGWGGGHIRKCHRAVSFSVSLGTAPYGPCPSVN